MGFWEDVFKGAGKGAAAGGLGAGIPTGGVGAIPGAIVGGIAGGIHGGVTSGSGSKSGGQKATTPISLSQQAPLTAEVQNREQMKAALEALIPAARKDAERRERILGAADTSGRRQSAEQLMQETRGFETGTGVQAARGRQRAAETLMAQHQIAAQRADETPEFDMANLQANVISQIQALGTLMMDQAGKLASYSQLIDAWPDNQRNQVIEIIKKIELSQADPDQFIVSSLDSLAA
jgi:hypothetical protein